MDQLTLIPESIHSDSDCNAFDAGGVDILINSTVDSYHKDFVLCVLSVHEQSKGVAGISIDAMRMMRNDRSSLGICVRTNTPRGAERSRGGAERSRGGAERPHSAGTNVHAAGQNDHTARGRTFTRRGRVHLNGSQMISRHDPTYATEALSLRI